MSRIIAVVLVAVGLAAGSTCEALGGSLWSFEGDLTDSVNGYDLSSVGSVSYAPGHSGQSLSLDGTAYAQLSDGDDLNYTGDLRLEAWLKVSEVPGDVNPRPLVAKWGAQDQYLLMMSSPDGSTFNFALALAGAAGNDDLQYLDVHGDLTVGEWIHVVGMFEDATNQMTLYVGDESDPWRRRAAKVSSIVDTIQSTAEVVQVGYYEGWYFTGQLDEVRVSQDLTVPEPAGLGLIGLGLLALRRRRG